MSMVLVLGLRMKRFGATSGLFLLLTLMLTSCGGPTIFDDDSLSKKYRFTVELSTSMSTGSDPFVRVHVNDYRLSSDYKELTLLDGALIHVVRFDADTFAHKFSRWDLQISPLTEIVIKSTDGAVSHKFYRGKD